MEKALFLTLSREKEVFMYIDWEGGVKITLSRKVRKRPSIKFKTGSDGILMGHYSFFKKVNGSLLISLQN